MHMCVPAVPHQAVKLRFRRCSGREAMNMGSKTERSARFCTNGQITIGANTLSVNEAAWINFMRLISNGRDLAPTLKRVQLLLRVCEGR